MSSKKAVTLKSGGKQYNVKVGDRIKVDLLESKAGDTITLSDVLLAVDSDDSVVVGTPLISNVSVEAKVLGHRQDKKVIIFKKNRRTGYTKKQGHRQTRTELLIQGIKG